MTNIIVDENITLAQEAFSQFGNIQLLSGRNISNNELKDVDALIVRSVTRVNEELLKGTNIKFVGTATIGTDHIDLEYLKSKNIFFSDAAGCNADAVAEYVFTAIMYLLKDRKLLLKDMSIGIVGVGNIGSRIAKLANALGMRVLLNDPPLKRKTGSTGFLSIDHILNADIVTLHVPLNKEGADKTVHLFDYEKLSKLKRGAILINASRGPVVDNLALIDMIKEKSLRVILDVWENEPRINLELLKLVKIASPHVAGYSLEGKINGTIMIYNALRNFLGEQKIWQPQMPAVQNNILKVSKGNPTAKKLYNLFSAVYNILLDDANMRGLANMSTVEAGVNFDLQRKNYPYRREFSNYIIGLDKNNKGLDKIIKAFRFNLS